MYVCIMITNTTLINDKMLLMGNTEHRVAKIEEIFTIYRKKLLTTEFIET